MLASCRIQQICIRFARYALIIIAHACITFTRHGMEPQSQTARRLHHDVESHIHLVCYIHTRHNNSYITIHPLLLLLLLSFALQCILHGHMKAQIERAFLRILEQFVRMHVIAIKTDLFAVAKAFQHFLAEWKNNHHHHHDASNTNTGCKLFSYCRIT